MSRSRKWEVIFDPEGLTKKIRDLEEESLKPGFWDDQRKAGKLLKEKKSLEDRLNAYTRLSEEAADEIASCGGASMTVDHISLMRSDRGKYGMIYTEL